MTEPTLPDNTLAEMARLKSYFPFRIVYAAQDPSNGWWLVYAATSMRQPNSFVRKGWVVVRAA